VNPIQRMGCREIARPAVLRRRVPKPPRKSQPRATTKPRHGFWRFGNVADAGVWCNAYPVGWNSGCDALPLRSTRNARDDAVIGHWGKCCDVAANIGGRPGSGVSADGPRMVRVKEHARRCAWGGAAQFATGTDTEDVLFDHFISYDGLSYLIVFVPGSIS
jgi:hypothetical protein